jgi:hypothetical protein
MTTLRARSLAVLGTVVMVVAPMAPAFAQAQPKAPSVRGDGTVASARSHFAHGVKLYEEDDFRAALIEFTRAYELAPNWGVLYNVGQSYYQLRDYDNALRTLEKYVAQGGDQIPPDRRSQVQHEIEELRGRVAHVTIKASVPGADVTLDDAAIGKSPVGEAVLVSAGRHKLTASKVGYLPTTKLVDIAGGDNLTIALDLAPEPHEPAVVARTEPVAKTETPNYTAAAITAGVGVAGIALGTVFGVAAIDNKANLSKNCDALKTCPSSEQGEITAFSRNGTISTIGFAAGGAGLALGAYFFFHERSKESPQHPTSEPATKHAAITPWLGFGSAGVSGSF